jgi:hypothetical protein
LATARTTIELNGKLYDARTGKILGDAGETPKPAVKSPGGMVVDGFVRRSTAGAAQPAKQPVGAAPVKVKVKAVVSRTTPTHAKPKLQKPKTLMRPAVRKPKPAVKSDITAQKHVIALKQDPSRVVRAAAVEKSSTIKRFQPAVPSSVIKKAEVLAVATPSHSVSNIATAAEAGVRQSVDAIEESLRSATAHLQTFEGKLVHNSFLERVGFRHKVANLSAMAFAGFLLLGFFTYQNIPNIQMRVAAARSGVSAQMPNYNPAGYSASRNVQGAPGKVTVAFFSNTDNKSYKVTQQASNWTSASLLANHVMASKNPYQTYQDEGKTVYIYNNSSATWVNSGIWYTIDGDASLSTDQLLKIANSF